MEKEWCPICEMKKDLTEWTDVWGPSLVVSVNTCAPCAEFLETATVVDNGHGIPTVLVPKTMKPLKGYLLGFD